MKPTGFIKHVDFLGRFKIPKELLLSYDIKPYSNIKLSRKRNSIIISKETHTCIFCNSTGNIHVFKDKYICQDCIEKIYELL